MNTNIQDTKYAHMHARKGLVCNDTYAQTDQHQERDSRCGHAVKKHLPNIYGRVMEPFAPQRPQVSIASHLVCAAFVFVFLTCVYDVCLCTVF
jgi:hypothetical protein